MNYIEKAVEYALSNSIKPIGRNSISRFAALLVFKDEMYFGLNSYKTHPLQARFSHNPAAISTHAEVQAIRNAVQGRARELGVHYSKITDLSDFELFVARVLKNGTPCLAKPCNSCWKAIKHFKIAPENVRWSL